MVSAHELVRSFVIGYTLSVLIEAPVLVLGLSPRHSLRCRLFAGIWLTACTYPIVCLVLPNLMPGSRSVYLAASETFAAVAECFLFWAAFVQPHGPVERTALRDFAVITLANLASFLAGELWYVLVPQAALLA